MAVCERHEQTSRYQAAERLGEVLVRRSDAREGRDSHVAGTQAHHAVAPGGTCEQADQDPERQVGDRVRTQVEDSIVSQDFATEDAHNGSALFRRPIGALKPCA
jgi:hypothetical protein